MDTTLIMPELSTNKLPRYRTALTPPPPPRRPLPSSPLALPCAKCRDLIVQLLAADVAGVCQTIRFGFAPQLGGAGRDFWRYIGRTVAVSGDIFFF